MYIINIIIFSVIVIPYTVVYIKKYKLTPVSVFLTMEISYFFGICLAPKGKLDVAIKLETIYVVALFFFILGVEFSKRLKSKKIYDDFIPFVDNVETHNQSIAIWIIIFISILLCSYLFAKGGTNVFLRSLQDLFSGSSGVYKSERRKFFSVSGMGYIYQFRAILLPILTIYVAYCSKRKLPKFIALALLILMLVFLLGTGQRNAFVFFCLIVLLYSITMQMKYNIIVFSKKQYIIMGVAAGVFLVALTIGNGRVSSDGNIITGAIESLVDRISGVNQRTAINAFSYIDEQPTSWGYDWLMTIRDILPGKSGYLTVSRITYYLAYGTYRGTGDPCIWGSAWYNFNFIGVTFFPFLIGWLYHREYKKMVSTPYKNRLYMLIYSGLSVYLGLWVYGTPMNLFNIGVVSLLFLRFLLFNILDHKTGGIKITVKKDFRIK